MRTEFVKIDLMKSKHWKKGYISNFLYFAVCCMIRRNRQSRIHVEFVFKCGHVILHFNVKEARFFFCVSIFQSEWTVIILKWCRLQTIMWTCPQTLGDVLLLCKLKLIPLRAEVWGGGACFIFESSTASLYSLRWKSGFGPITPPPSPSP